MEPKQKPVASLFLDLDNLWSYMKTHGEAGWKSFPTYLDKVVPVALDTMDRLGLRNTSFIVSQDVALSKIRRRCAALWKVGTRREIVRSSHEP